MGYLHETYQQYFNGTKVEFGVYKIHSQQGEIRVAMGIIYLFNSLILFLLTAEQAIVYAKNYIQAVTYSWDENPSTYPVPQLVICQDFNKKGNIAYAYKMEIHVLNPLRKADFFVDASNGAILLENAIIKHVGGTAATRYSGSQTIQTTNIGNYFLLRYLNKREWHTNL